MKKYILEIDDLNITSDDIINIIEEGVTMFEDKNNPCEIKVTELSTENEVQNVLPHIEPHYFIRHNLGTNDRFCDKCGLYLTDAIHKRKI